MVVGESVERLFRVGLGLEGRGEGQRRSRGRGADRACDALGATPVAVLDVSSGVAAGGLVGGSGVVVEA